MSVVIDEHDITVLQGDVQEQLATLAPASIDCVVTSPPYYGLRDYGVAGQLGLESTPQEYIDAMLDVAEGLGRVLRPDGTLWLNLGDAYSGKANGGPSFDRHRGHGHAAGVVAPQVNTTRFAPYKSLMGMPWRIALAMIDAGWILRNDIIWNKPNAMPESVDDRLGGRHEHLFMFARTQRYQFDLDAIRVPHAPKTVKDFGDGQSNGKAFGNPLVPDNNWEPRAARRRLDPRGVNPGDVWTIATTPYAGAHFATFPAALPERCILAGCPAGGTVLDPFAGSGTTLAVARALGRKSIGIELNPAYVEIIRERIGQTPFEFEVTA